MLPLHEIKRSAAEVTRTAKVGAFSFTLFYMLITLILNLADLLTLRFLPNGGNFLHFFIYLLFPVFAAGFVMYCMRIYRGEQVGYGAIFDGFTFPGKVLGLYFLMAIFIALWSMLFVIPGIIATYRYRFAVYNLYEDPTISPLEALRRSKRQTMGHKMNLLMLDLSFLGWLLLTNLPSNVFSWLAAAEILVLNDFVHLFLCWGISTAASLCYLPRFHVSVYTYFNLARAACAPTEPPMIEE